MIENSNTLTFLTLKKVKLFSFFYFLFYFFFKNVKKGLFIVQLVETPKKVEPAVIGLSIALVITGIFLISALIYIYTLRRKNDYTNIDGN